jgi:hypothetical protein
LIWLRSKMEWCPEEDCVFSLSFSCLYCIIYSEFQGMSHSLAAQSLVGTDGREPKPRELAQSVMTRRQVNSCHLLADSRLPILHESAIHGDTSCGQRVAEFWGHIWRLTVLSRRRALRCQSPL